MTFVLHKELIFFKVSRVQKRGRYELNLYHIGVKYSNIFRLVATSVGKEVRTAQYKKVFFLNIIMNFAHLV